MLMFIFMLMIWIYDRIISNNKNKQIISSSPNQQYSKGSKSIPRHLQMLHEYFSHLWYLELIRPGLVPVIVVLISAMLGQIGNLMIGLMEQFYLLLVSLGSRPIFIEVFHRISLLSLLLAILSTRLMERMEKNFILMSFYHFLLKLPTYQLWPSKFI